MRHREQITSCLTDDSNLILIDQPYYMSDEEAESIINQYENQIEIEIKCVTMSDVSCATPGGENCGCCQLPV